MAYDEGLAQRVRECLGERTGLAEKRMFGGLAFLLGGRMCVGIVRDDLMVRVGPAAHERLLREPHARPMDFTGRPMRGFLFVDGEGLEDDAALQRWVARALEFQAEVPPRKGRRG